MELQQSRSFQGRKPTHDFLSLYSPVQQDHGSSQGGYLKTYDFLHPLEHIEKNSEKHDNIIGIIVTGSPSITPVAPYSISYLSNFNPKVPKTEGEFFTVAQGSTNDRNEESSNCSSYTGSGFTLWDESTVKKGKMAEECVGEERSSLVKEPVVKLGKWSSERPSQSSSSHINCFSSLSTPQLVGQKSQNFIDIIKASKVTHEEEDDGEFTLKMETSPHRGYLGVNDDGKISDMKANNTPRSKHSATEQRRRSKINDRFQTLREIIPHSDQKRDKASFLLEVIEYIRFLQGNVQKDKGSYQGWNPEPPRVSAWRNKHSPPPLFAVNMDENNINPLSVPIQTESDKCIITPLSGMDSQDEISKNSIPISMRPNMFGSMGAMSQAPLRLSSNAENVSRLFRSKLRKNEACSTDFILASDKEQEMDVEGGAISFSSVYSQGLLNTLTQALQSSGVDLSQASISVQIELCKPSNSRPSVPSSATTLKNSEVPTSHEPLERLKSRSRVSTRGNAHEPEPLKRFKMSKS